MLHRLALRVLPSLTVAVTEEAFRKRKRIVMLVPGLVAFGVYRGTKHVVALSDPLVLLVTSGLLAACIAVGAYRAGRAVTFAGLWREDGVRCLSWLAGWIGFVYGVQLSLLVLALLKIVAQYDFLQHPDGPAMMAMIIAGTSVARDAFEIGHVRWLHQQGRPMMASPDGRVLRTLLMAQTARIVPLALAAAGLSWLAAFAVAESGPMGRSMLAQGLLVTVTGGSLSLWAYLSGEQGGQWRVDLNGRGGLELFRFWWWPGLAFAATYYCVAVGFLVFLLRMEPGSPSVYGVVAGGVGGLMALYGYYLGYQREREDQVSRVIPASLLRCPFVMGILSKKGHASAESPAEALASSSGRRR